MNTLVRALNSTALACVGRVTCFGTILVLNGSLYRLNGSHWQMVNSPDARRWTINKHRVLLSRARVGSIIWLPQGRALDATRDPVAHDEIAATLYAAGASQPN
jgi:hypothetical protein